MPSLMSEGETTRSGVSQGDGGDEVGFELAFGGSRQAGYFGPENRPVSPVWPLNFLYCFYI